MSARIGIAIVVVGAATCLPVVWTAAQTRDTRSTAAVAATASLSGRVVAAEDPGVPVPRAIVTVAGPVLEVARSTVSDDRGAFVLQALPPGSFTVSATKVAYLAGAYGSTHTGQAGTPVVVPPGAHVTDVTIALARGAVIAGAVRSASGAPLRGIHVIASRAGDPPTAIPLLSGPNDSTFTDDRGAFRLFGLPPGDYTVVALPLTPTSLSGEAHARRTADVDAIFQALRQRTTPGGVASTPVLPPAQVVTLAPVYYPGTADVSQSTPITVGIGETRQDVDFIVAPVPSVSIAGTITGLTGGPAQMVITGASRSTPLVLAMAPRLVVAPSSADGRFTYVDVTPGHYTITALGADRSANGSPLSLRWALTDVDVRDSDVTGLTLALQPGLRVAGRIVFDGATTPPSTDPTTLRLSIGPASDGGSAMANGTAYGLPQRSVSASIGADGTFDLAGVVPGAYRLMVREGSGSPLTGWWLRSFVLEPNGRDMLDGPMTIAPDRDYAHAVLTLSDRHTVLAGSLRTPAGRPATEYFVIVFPADRALWPAGARRIRSTRPSTNGTFDFSDLPPGMYTLAAVSDLTPADLDDPRFLEATAPAGVSVTLGEGAHVTQDLRLSGSGG